MLVIEQGSDSCRFRLIAHLEPNNFWWLSMYQAHFVKISILGSDDVVVINGVLANNKIVYTLQAN